MVNDRNRVCKIIQGHNPNFGVCPLVCIEEETGILTEQLRIVDLAKFEKYHHSFLNLL